MEHHPVHQEGEGRPTQAAAGLLGREEFQRRRAETEERGGRQELMQRHLPSGRVSLEKALSAVPRAILPPIPMSDDGHDL